MLRVFQENAVLSDARLRDIQNSHTKVVKELMEVFSPRKEISIGNTTNMHIGALPDEETPEVGLTGSRLGRLARTSLLGATVVGTLGAGAMIPFVMNYFEPSIITEPQKIDLYEYLENRGLNRIDDK